MFRWLRRQEPHLAWNHAALPGNRELPALAPGSYVIVDGCRQTGQRIHRLRKRDGTIRDIPFFSVPPSAAYFNL